MTTHTQPPSCVQRFTGRRDLALSSGNTNGLRMWSPVAAWSADHLLPEAMT